MATAEPDLGKPQFAHHAAVEPVVSAFPLQHLIVLRRSREMLIQHVVHR